MIDKPLKILLNGRACSGKDTVAKYLNEEFGFACFSFAEGIYDIAYIYFNMKGKDRALLQAIGQKMREIDPDIWVRATYNESENHYYGWNCPVVITDCRQANEYLAGVERGYIPIRVSAPLEQRVRRALIRDKNIDPDNHLLDFMVNNILCNTISPDESYYIDISKWENESENGADNFEYIELINDGTINELHKKINDIINGILSGKLWTPG